MVLGWLLVGFIGFSGLKGDFRHIFWIVLFPAMRQTYISLSVHKLNGKEYNFQFNLIYIGFRLVKEW